MHHGITHDVTLTPTLTLGLGEMGLGEIEDTSESVSMWTGRHNWLMVCSLPKDQDCHELWSKRRKKVMRDPGVEKKSDLLGDAAVSHSGSGNQWSPESEASNAKHSDVLSPTATSQRKH